MAIGNVSLMLNKLSIYDIPWHNSASEMFANLNIPSFDKLLRIFVFGFRSRIIVSNNLFTSSIYNSTCRIYSYILYVDLVG